jgi:hypothetical protein
VQGLAAIRIAGSQAAGFTSALLGVLLALAGCNESDALDQPLRVSFAQQRGFPDTVKIRIENVDNRPICISGTEINNGYENLEIAQGGARLHAASSTNRALRDYNSLNALEPIYLLLPGNNEFWYDLGDFPLKKGKFTVSANLRAARCADLFGSDAPHWIHASAQAAFSYDPDAR